VLILPVESAGPAVYVNVYPLFEPAAKTLSIRPAAEAVGGVAPGPNETRSGLNPVLKVEAYVISLVLIVRRDPTAEAWFAAIRERSRSGMAIAAMIRMIATTISSSISEKPREFFLITLLLVSFHSETCKNGCFGGSNCHSKE
jgi:hypothetical protein